MAASAGQEQVQLAPRKGMSVLAAVGMPAGQRHGLAKNLVSGIAEHRACRGSYSAAVSGGQFQVQQLRTALPCWRCRGQRPGCKSGRVGCGSAAGTLLAPAEPPCLQQSSGSQMLTQLQHDSQQQLSGRASAAKAACSTLPSLRICPDSSLARFVLQAINTPSSCWGPSAAPVPAQVVHQLIDFRDLTYNHQFLPTFPYAWLS